jgi:cellobiose epimerase
MKVDDHTSQLLHVYREQLLTEWKAILRYWMQHTVDEANGGFLGAVDNQNQPVPDAAKGLVMHSRILWAFSAAYNFFKDSAYLTAAKKAFDYICQHFSDREHGGMYWSVDAAGNRLDGKKQVYGQAFCIYGMSEYYKACGDAGALKISIELFQLIEQYSYDTVQGGYLEAFTREWQVMDDLRLSEKDANEKKTMNTHLHVIEGYVNLYRVWKDARLCERIEGLLELFDKYIIDKQTGHLHLFFDEQWNNKETLISYGHDIEAAWLLQECAEAVDNRKYIEQYRRLAIFITDAAARGLDADGGLWYEYFAGTGYLVKEKHSWPQAEAMIGFMNAYELSAEDTYLRHSLNSWAFVQHYLLDTVHGEWFWGVKEDYSIMEGQDKAGFWKCPYHNSRACMQIISRIDKMS